MTIFKLNGISLYIQYFTNGFAKRFWRFGLNNRIVTTIQEIIGRTPTETLFGIWLEKDSCFAR